MNPLDDPITAELQVLVGEPLTTYFRCADMQAFEFGRTRKRLNRMGQEVEDGQISLHIQCRWRFVDATKILFGRDDLRHPADPSLPALEFDSENSESVLDCKLRGWFAATKASPLRVLHASGDIYGGFRLALENDIVIEAFPCDSDPHEYSEHWRLFGHRPDGGHFVVSGRGIDIVTAGP